MDDEAAAIAFSIATDATSAAERYFAVKDRALREAQLMDWGAGVAAMPESVGRMAAEIFEQRIAQLATLN